MNRNEMKIEIKVITNGIQSINRFLFTGRNGTVTYVDLWDDEIKELEEQIQQWKGPE